MRRKFFQGLHSRVWAAGLLVWLCLAPAPARAFEGRIRAVMTRGVEVMPLLYTAGTNCLRIETSIASQPYPVNLLNLDSGELTLVFPHIHSFIRVKSPAAAPAPGGSAPTNLPGASPPPMAEQAEINATGDRTNLLGLACDKYEIKARDEVMEVWATAQLLPFQPWQTSQMPSFGPHRVEEQWAGLLMERKLFPLQAVLRQASGAERLRFEVRSIQLETIADKDGTLFQPPPDYTEVPALPF
jgi:hypothetical protein